MSKRVRLPPRAADAMDAGARNWLLMTAKKNYWRVAPWIELEDLIQDGYMLWISTRRRYMSAIYIPHIMRLFQVTYVNHIHDLARQSSRLLEQPFSQFDDSAAFAITNLEACQFSELLRLMAEAPGNLKAILIALHSKDRPLRPRVRTNGVRATLNERLAHLVKVSPSDDPAKKLRGFLKS